MNCIVPGCDNSYRNNKCVRFHRLPTRNDKVLAVWLHRINNLYLDAWTPIACRNRYICSDHFADVCKEGIRNKEKKNRTTLKINALPTVKLPGFKGDPYLEEHCIMDRVTFNLGKSLNASTSNEDLLKMYREMGAVLDKNICAIGNTSSAADSISEMEVASGEEAAYWKGHIKQEEEEYELKCTDICNEYDIIEELEDTNSLQSIKAENVDEAYVLTKDKIKQEKACAILEAQTSSDEDLDKDTCLKNFMKTEITIDDQQEFSVTDKCILCHKLFTDTSILSEHIVICKKQRKHKCTICYKAFTRKSHLSLHLLIHSKIKQFKCTVCDKEFTRKSHLTQHFLVHSGIKEFKCTICDKDFARKTHLSQHLLTHDDTKQFKCTVCDKAFSQKGNLSQHLLIHKAIKPYKCNICDLTFALKISLTHHLLNHEGIKAFKCTFCDKAFSLKSNLTRHTFIHNNVKAHECTICHKAFTQKTHLAEHFLIHSGKKDFKCTVCDKAFAQKSALSQHSAIHKDVRLLKYNCTICDKAFTKRPNLTKHLLIHNNIKPFKCTVCDKAFNQKFNLTRHIATHNSPNKAL